MSLWSKIWSVLDSYFLWLLDSDGDALVRDIAERIPDDPREQCMPAQLAASDHSRDRTAA